MSKVRLFAAVMLLISTLSLLPRPAQAATLDYDIPNGHFFTQANGQPPGASAQGYSVTNDGGIAFWDEFQRLGGVDTLGYPSSTRFTLDGFTVQAFQKVIMQWRPEVGQAYFLNTMDLLHDAGKDGWLGGVHSIPGVLPTSFDDGKDWDGVQAARWALLDDNPAISAAYWNSPDPLNLNGLPLSPVKDEGNAYMIRTQRKVYQQWKVDVPWASAGQVTVANGGDLYKEAGMIPANAATPQDPPSGDASAPAPVAAPAPGGSGYPGVGYGFQIDPGNDPGHAMDMTKAAGFSWVKAQVRWESTEPQKGNIQWGTMDNIANLAAARGLNVLFSIVTAPMWSRPGTDQALSGPPNDPQDYANFVGAIASRFKGKVQAYEIWNEENLSGPGGEWGAPGQQNAAGYVALLKAAYGAIKAADPNAVVLLGAMTPAGTVDLGQGPLAIDDVDFLRQMYAAGAQPYFDAVAVHPSGFNNAPDDYDNSGAAANFKGHRSFYFRNFENYHQVMVDNNDGNKQLWFTEFGWAVAQGTAPPKDRYAYATQNTEQQQSDWLVRAFQIAKASGYVGPMFVWNLNFANSADAGDTEALRAFSVLHPDWTGRPAYNALAAMPK